MPFNIFATLAAVLNVVYVLLLVRIILSWVAPRADRYQQPFRFVFGFTDPILEPFRRLIPPIGGIDFSPIIPFMLIGFIQRALHSMAFSM